ncbi:alpha/beta-hydrolase [Choiromyces venosus 120613-1]|uniref:Alpha/beta-hydrolase n=1 Tax=Choiromyces venosus 120613-1 TaxID=1336337 RepID=A0A3N4JTF5_9PEZI|nr:alpha/beta-hydrolase [Choiromyces venosus 120613-1]
MASNPPGECCMKGFMHEGTPVGEVVQFAEAETYITKPASGSTEKVLLLLTDVLGINNNPKLIADDFAKNGYTVVMPDLFAGDKVPPQAERKPDFQLPEWLEKHQPHHVIPIIQKVLGQIRAEFNPRKIGALGYCFGAKYVTQLLAGDIDAGYTAHPSFVTLDELAAVKGPLAISAAETDSLFTPDLRHASEAKLAEIKATYQIILFSGVEHGFAVRCDLKDEWQRWSKEEAFCQAVRWFKLHLA